MYKTGEFDKKNKIRQNSTKFDKKFYFFNLKKKSKLSLKCQIFSVKDV